MRDADIIESFQLQAFERLGSIYPAEQAKDLSDQIAVELRRCSPPIVAEAAGRLWSEQNLSRLVSIVILLPFFPYSSDDGFAVIDYQRINPELGDCPQIAAITHHFDPMIDLVINHVSSQHRWFQQFLRNEELGKNYFISPPDAVELTQVVRPRQSPRLSEVKTDCGPDKIWTTFSADRIDTNFSNPEVLLEHIKVLLF